jgi:hypothetical protein
MHNGILTIAIGKRYRSMAKTLARSIWISNSKTKIAIVTDCPTDFDSMKERVIPIPHCAEYGAGVQQKLYLERYSPFDQTMFIDSDCLVFGSLDPLWASCFDQDFAVFGHDISDARSWGYFEQSDLKALGITGGVPQFNGGIYYFNRSKVSARIFEIARSFSGSYQQHQIANFRNGVADEPLFSIALAHCGLSARDNSLGQLATPVDFGFSPAEADVFTGTMVYKRNGETRQVIVAHFFGEWTGTYLYWIETFRLRYSEGLLRTFLPSLSKRLGDTLYYSCLAIRNLLLRNIRPSTACLPRGLVVIPFSSFTSKLRSLFGRNDC